MRAGETHNEAINDPLTNSLFSLSLHRLKRHAKNEEPSVLPSSIFRPDRNYWLSGKAKRASFLIDADAFFRAFVEAAAQAEKQLIIVGWDTDTRTELPWPEGVVVPGLERQESVQLGTFLKALTDARPELRIYVLSWDFAFIYLFEREGLPSFKYSSLSTDRLRFVLDREHPTLASHHQKIVVVDDQVAFSGGLDITQRRWDTPEHKGFDQRRVDPGGHVYGPFHDVQLCVEGDVARTLGDLVRERWKVATGEVLDRAEPRRSTQAPWPAGARENLRDVEFAISRTLPLAYAEKAFHAETPVCEVQKLFLDAIRSARKYVYIENQYFTSSDIAHAIAERLKEPEGPEFVMVLPRDQTGWIEESTMGLLRSEALRIVEKADRFGRFRAYHPIVPGLDEGYVKVHSKVMVVDDVFLRIGSANMNSRSMGLDTECDLSVEALGRKEVREAFAKLRADLLGEHLGVASEEFEARFKINGSLVKTVESFLGAERTLVPIHPSVPEWVRKVAPPKDWVDPSEPNGIRRWFADRLWRARHVMAATLVLIVTLGLFFLSHLEAQGRLPASLSNWPSPAQLVENAWTWSRSWDAEKIASQLAAFREQSWAFPVVLIGFVLGSLILVPVTAMILGVAIAFPAEQAVVLALAGATLSATAMYGIGRYWAWSKSRVLNRPWVQKLSDQMSRGGVWAVVAVRLAPIAPFTAVGIVAGGLRVPLRNYVLGTMIGLSPGVLALTLLSNSAVGLSDSRSWYGLLWVLIALSLFSFLLPRLIKRLRRTT
jgi:phosphatidylserine/phosphatidylglycerophosphate/cardiolipin synthase-like enzyme/uncharacterized membrane protein YdjX (TVP38/TMEM64 family)